MDMMECHTGGESREVLTMQETFAYAGAFYMLSKHKSRLSGYMQVCELDTKEPRPLYLLVYLSSLLATLKRREKIAHG